MKNINKNCIVKYLKMIKFYLNSKSYVFFPQYKHSRFNKIELNTTFISNTYKLIKEMSVV